jgi:3-phenylpropionate/cinnamic acid dioxygenase small subunit
MTIAHTESFPQTTPKQQRSLERFYYREARLLDGREYRQWLTLIDPSIEYSMPARTNVQVDNRDRGNESMISVQAELEDAQSSGCPLREERYIHLMLRVERAFKINSWSENPPARTRRIVGNIELEVASDDLLSVISNFHLYYARPSSGSVIYSGQRRDVLLPQSETDSYLIAKREIVMDYADIEVPTMGLLL